MGFFTAFAQGALDKREEIEAAQSDKQAEMQKYMQENMTRALELRALDRERARKYNERSKVAADLGASPALQAYYAATDNADISILMDKTYTVDDKGATIDPKNFGALPALTPAISAEERTQENLQEPERKKAGFVNFLFGIDPNMEANAMGTIGKANNMSEKGVRGLLQQFGTGDFATSAPTKSDKDTSRLMFSKDSSDVQKNTGEIYSLNNYENPVKAQALIEKLERAKGNPAEQSRIREELAYLRTTPEQDAARRSSSQDKPDKVYNNEKDFAADLTRSMINAYAQNSAFTESIDPATRASTFTPTGQLNKEELKVFNDQKADVIRSLTAYKLKFGIVNDKGKPISNIYFTTDMQYDLIAWTQAGKPKDWVQYETAILTPPPKQEATGGTSGSQAPDSQARTKILSDIARYEGARKDAINSGAPGAEADAAEFTQYIDRLYAQIGGKPRTKLEAGADAAPNKATKAISDILTPEPSKNTKAAEEKALAVVDAYNAGNITDIGAVRDALQKALDAGSTSGAIRKSMSNINKQR